MSTEAIEIMLPRFASHNGRIVAVIETAVLTITSQATKDGVKLNYRLDFNQKVSRETFGRV